MEYLTKDQIAAVKARGFLWNNGSTRFSGRVLATGSVFTAEQLIAVGQIAQTLGNGTIAFTSRLSAEIVGIPYDCIPQAEAMAAENGLSFGGTGAKIRPIVACKGTTCVYGNYDTQAMAAELFQRYFLGWSAVKLPHKFKIAIGGCPNSCMKVSLNDFGVEGHRSPGYDPALCRGCKVCQVEQRCPSKAAKLSDGHMQLDETKCLTCGVCIGTCPFGAVQKEAPVQYRIYVGGTWGRKSRNGTPLSQFVGAEDIFPLLEKTMLWYKENGLPKERLGAAIDRLGFELFEQSIFSNDLLLRKADILGQ